MQQAFAAAISRQPGLFGKALWILKLWTIVPFMILGSIIHVFWSKLNAQKLKNNKPRQISKSLFVVDGYAPVPVTTRMLIFRNSANKLALVSPLRPEPETVEQVKQLGEVDAIIVPSLGHDTFTPAWAKLFPNARIAATTGCMKAVKQMYTEKGVNVTHTQDDVLLDYPGIFTHTPPDGCVTTGEVVYECLNDDGTRTLITFDLQVNNDWHSTYFPEASGFGSHRTARMHQLMFIADAAKFRNFMLNVVCKISRVNRLIFAHGNIIEGNDVSARIAAAVVRDFP